MSLPLTDFHVHPDYSIDAKGSIDEFCDAAIEKGIKSICFTTHYDSNPRRVEQDGYWVYRGKRERISDNLVAHYVDDIESAREKFSNHDLKILRGLEIDYFPGVEKETERLRKEFPLDFVIGSVHCVNDIAISDPNEATVYFQTHGIESLVKDYFSLLLSAAECDLFDCLGHLDYYIRYGRAYFGDEINRIEIEHFDPVFAKLKSGSLGIEINTGPFRKRENRFHPSREITKRAIEAGVRIVSVGSDSHSPAQLGGGIREALDFLSELNSLPEMLSKI